MAAVGEAPGELLAEDTALVPRESSAKEEWWGSTALAWAVALSGPGMMVSLADTDGSCLMVAAKSGIEYGYDLLLLQFLLLPVLFLAQELTVRVGVHARKGHTACILHQFGYWPAACSLAVLLASCTGAVVSELATVSAVASLYGASQAAAAWLAAVLLAILVLTANYRQIEIMAVLLGLFELVFVVSMFMANPSWREIGHGISGGFQHWSDTKYHWLVASNIGAVVMPWMIYFQQSAIVARRLHTEKQAHDERVDTAVGTVLTQLIMVGTLVTMAATRVALGRNDMNNISNMVDALGHVFSNKELARALVSVAFVGGSMCAALVVTLAAAWGVSELRGDEDGNAMEVGVSDAPVFYGTYMALVIVATTCVSFLSQERIVHLSVAVSFIDALLMPVTLFCLYKIATNPQLPDHVRVIGGHRITIVVCFSICSVCAIATGVSGLLL